MTGSTDGGFVVFEHVQKSYDGVTIVVADLNLAIKKGEFVTMLGPCERSSNPVARDRRKREHVRYWSVWRRGRGVGQCFGVARAAGAGLRVV